VSLHRVITSKKRHSDFTAFLFYDTTAKIFRQSHQPGCSSKNIAKKLVFLKRVLYDRSRDLRLAAAFTEDALRSFLAKISNHIPKYLSRRNRM